MIDTPILIAGGGPVGMTLALALARQGVRSIVVERNPTTTRHPKMDLTNGRSMEIYRRLGVADALRAAGVPVDNPFDIVWATSPSGEVLHRFAYPSSREAADLIRRANDGTGTREAPMRISQIVLEPVLREALDHNDLVDIRFGHRFRSLEADQDGVTATIEGPDGAVVIRSRYLVGCDGGGSTVRTALDIQLEGQYAVGRGYMIHFRSEAREILAPFGVAWHLQTGTGTLIAQNDIDIWTLHTFIAPGADEAALDPRKVLLDFVGRPFEFEILIANPWSPHLLVADQYSKGPAILAGDAAHQFIPTGGYGMNTGVGEAFDLGWKLGAVVSGWGGEALLESYEVERRPIAIRNREMAAAHAGVRMEIVQLVSTAMAEGPLQANDDAGRARLETLGRAIEAAGNAENESWGIEHGYRYDASPIIAYDDEPAPPPDPLVVALGTWPGSRLPHLYLEDGRALYDLLGDQFTILAIGDISTGALEVAATTAGVPVRVVRLKDEPVLKLLERPLVLIRPDDHIAWRGWTFPDDALAMLKHVTGRAT